MTNDTPKAGGKFSDDQWHADNTAAGFMVTNDKSDVPATAEFLMTNDCWVDVSRVMINNRQKPRISRENWEEKCVPRFLMMSQPETASSNSMFCRDSTMIYLPETAHRLRRVRSGGWKILKCNVSTPLSSSIKARAAPYEAHPELRRLSYPQRLS